ncbi:SOS response-associated peptidase [Leptospira sp. id769339]|uniref:SOS response-associated peptidase n=1 Tax=Leptospira sp. id769339 TaxID=2864221 RepID=UPI00214CC43E|nr:SOS response-associated peptidase [Leptospira sp. id769339]MCR1795359.1 SOS response-associated peptidase [Leptospira sp. id769339]
MCGRYSLNAELSQIIEQFGLRHDLERIEREYRPEKEVFPTSVEPVVRGSGEDRTLEFVKWGAKNLEVYDYNSGKTKIYKSSNPNAKYESLYKFPSWKPGITANRCIIPATSYWEWIENGPNKGDRYEIFYKEKELFGFAGIMGEFKEDDGKTYQGFVIVTFPANPLVAVIHRRQPGIILPENYSAWLDINTKEPCNLIHQVQGQDYQYKKVADGKREITDSTQNKKTSKDQFLLF